ncbi:Putative NAC domain transcription factor superfamily protein [Zea mays]|uniref:Putative NAC domain transcription factor superfamily protein n=1 Tax=Zea mays TaxID=4577 RepID=A0A1D6J067_MAIZE|nr:Putative NAC domain transcription factor superfamily protein [Zea mays]
MAANDHVFRATNEASVALLRDLRAGTVDPRFKAFIHHADVYTAVPEELVADLEPVPGTDVTEDGYNRQWYIYCPKRYKNGEGRTSGHRLRAVETAGTCWHSETGPKSMQGLPGATFCSLSYGHKEKEDEGTSGRHRFHRMGWRMFEYDDTQGGGGDHVLCKVHRSSSSLAKNKSKAKRTATGDHPEAPPTKVIHDVQDPAGAIFTGAYPTMDDPLMVRGEEASEADLGKFNLGDLLNIDNVDWKALLDYVDAKQQQQQPYAEPAKQSSDVQVYVDPAATLMPSNVHGHEQGGGSMMVGGEEEQRRRIEEGFNVDDLFDVNNVDRKALLEMLEDDEEQGLPLQQQPRAEPAAEQSQSSRIEDPSMRPFEHYSSALV